MNLSISPIRIPHAANNSSVSFGMAKFTTEGMRLAQTSADVYEPLATPTQFQDPTFFKDKKILRKAPFAKFIEKKVPAKRGGSADDVADVKNAIIECGTTNNAYANGKFIKQLLTTKKHIDSLPEASQTPIREGIAEVFRVNWNNPELSKAETTTLLEMSKGPIEDNQYVTLTGVIEKSDTPSK